MSVLLAAALAGAAAAALVALPSPGRLRFRELTPATRRSSAWGRRWPVSALPVALLLALLPGLVLGVLLGPVPGLLAPGVVLLAQHRRAGRRRGRARAAERAGAVQACSVLAAELSAGRTPAEALTAAAEVADGPVQEALGAAAAAAGLGGDVPAALVSTAPGSAVGPVLRSLAACWAVCAGSGSGLSAAVARLEDGLRADAALRRAVEAELAGPRATAAMLALLPAVGLLMAAGLGADPLRVLLETPAGLTCLALGLALDGLGLLWTDRLVARAGGAA